MGIDRLLKKFDKVKKAINSIKGIQSKIQSINYTTAMDSLGESQQAAEELLKTRRSNLQSHLGSNKRIGMGYSKSPPLTDNEKGVLVFPKYDKLMNYIMFTSLPRKKRGPHMIGHPVTERRRCALYIPDTLLSQAAVSFNAQGTNAVTRAMMAIGEAFQDGDGMNVTKDEAKKLMALGVNSMISQLTNGLSDVKNLRAINPQQEQVLDNIPFRTWDFTFEFWPKSKDEAKVINEIIYFFRSSMLPDVFSPELSLSLSEGIKTEEFNKDGSNNESYYNYPNIFKINFHGDIGKRIDGFLDAVCTNAQVDYTGGQKFSTMTDGMPTHIQLTLSFMEIQTMTLGNYDKQVSMVGRQFAGAGDETKLSQAVKDEGLTDG